MLRSMLVGLLLSIGCSSNDGPGTQNAGESNQDDPNAPYCTYSNCPNEPVVYPDKNACDNLYAGPCIEEWKTWNECVLSKERCGDDGRVIPESVESCDSAFSTLNDCLSDAAS